MSSIQGDRYETGVVPDILQILKHPSMIAIFRIHMNATRMILERKENPHSKHET